MDTSLVFYDGSRVGAPGQVVLELHTQEPEFGVTLHLVGGVQDEVFLCAPHCQPFPLHPGTVLPGGKCSIIVPET